MTHEEHIYEQGRLRGIEEARLALGKMKWSEDLTESWRRIAKVFASIVVRELKAYTNDEEWVIAYSPTDASFIAKETCPNWDEDGFEWQECPMQSTWTLAGDFTDAGEDEEKTFAEWIDLKGRCYLGTSNY